MTSHNAAPMRIHRFSKLWSVALFLFHVGTTCGSSNPSNNNVGFVSLKLTPHHAELEKRRRHLSSSAVGEKAASSLYDDEQYRRREEAVQVGALFEGYGTHYVDLWCGSPPQRQTVIVDTGSGVTAFPCSGCKDCGVPDYHVDRLFVEKESETFQKSNCDTTKDCLMGRSSCQSGTCKIGMSYAEGSRWNAYEAVDRCYVAGPHEIPLVAAKDSSKEGDDMDPMHAADLAFDMTFGCQTLVTGLFKTQLADGIMGMSNQPSTFWSQMFKANNMGSDKQFALCFSRPPMITKEGTEAGAMTMGGVDTRLHTSPMVYTPAFDKGRSSFFSVKVRRMMLRDGKYGESAKSTDKNPNKGVSILDVEYGSLNKGGIIVDSGTTDTYWNAGIGQEFSRVFKSFTGWAHHNQPIALTDEELAALPTILVQLESDGITNGHVDEPFKTPGLAGAMDPKHPNDVILAIPPSHYMEYNPEKEKYTSRFYPTERSGSVLGANAMMGHDVFFDMDNTRLGWAESDCDYTKTVTENGYSFEIDGKLKPVEVVNHSSKGNNSKGSNNGNKHTTNDEDTPEECESISSGTMCQKVEGCAWGWGKCKPVGGTTPHDEEAATVAPTDKTTSSGTIGNTIQGTTSGTVGNTIQGTTSGTSDFVELVSEVEGEDVSPAEVVSTLLNRAKEHKAEAGIGMGVAGALLWCICYCVCCRKTRDDSAKYERTATEPTIEMTNGSGFQDEPDDMSASNGSKASGHFRDNPDAEPEFEGDFA